MDQDYINQNLKIITEEAIQQINKRLLELNLQNVVQSIEYSKKSHENFSKSSLHLENEIMRCHVNNQGQVVCTLI